MVFLLAVEIFRRPICYQNFILSGALSPPPNRFDIPHSVTVSEDDNLVCVADRENGRISCFDFEGNFKILIKKKEFGPRLYAVEYCPMHGKIFLKY